MLAREELEYLTDAVLIGLNDAIESPFILAEQPNAPKLDYPFGAVKLIGPIRFVGQTAVVMRDGLQQHTQTVELVFSVTCYSNDTFAAQALAFEGWRFFNVDGHEPLHEQHITVVQTSDVRERTTFITDGYEYAWGFDTKLRIGMSSTHDDGVIETVEVNIKQEGGN